MDPQTTVLSNFQNWQFRCCLDRSGQIISGSLHDPEGKNMTFEVGYVWNQNVKKSKTSEGKTLFRNIEAVKQENDSKAFEACKRPEGIYIVFGKTKLREDSLLLGGLAFVGGCALIASGAGLIAAPFLGGGASTFIDAYKKDVVVFDNKENTKQGLIGAVTSIVTGCFSALFPVGAAASLGTKAAVSSASSTVGYITSAGLNGERPTLKGTLTAIVAGSVAPVASNKMGNAFTMPAADQVDDLATAMLVKSAAEGAAGAGASQMARNICDGKPLTEDLGLSVASGTMTSVAGTIPKVMEMLDRPVTKPTPQGNSNPSKKPDTSSSPTNQPSAASAPSNANNQPLRAAANDIWGAQIGKMISKGFKVWINGKWEKPPKSDAAYHQNNFLDMIANGKQLTFMKDGEMVTLGFTQVNNPADINHYIQKGWKFVLGGKLEKPPKKQGDYHSQNILEGMQQNGEIIRIQKDGMVRFLTTKPIPQPQTEQPSPVAPPQTTVSPKGQAPATQAERKADEGPEGKARTTLPGDTSPRQGDLGIKLHPPSSSSSSSEGEDGLEAAEIGELSEHEIEQMADLEQEQQAGSELPEYCLELVNQELADALELSEDDLDSIETVDLHVQTFEEDDDDAVPELVLDEVVQRRQEIQRRIDLQRLQSELITIQKTINSLVSQLNNLEANHRHHRGQIFKMQKAKLETQISAEWSRYFQKEDELKKLSQ